MGRLAAVSALALAVLAAGCNTRVASARPAPRPGGGLRILIFDIGQGDAQLLVGAERTMLVDLGDAPRARRNGWARRLAPRIESLAGGRRLDYVVVSHFHADHVGAHGSGVFALIDREGFRVGTLVDRGDDSFGTPRTTPHEQWLLASARWVAEGKVERRVTARARDRIDLGGGAVAEVFAAGGVGVLDARFRSHADDMTRCPPSENDYSVALKLTLGPFEYYTAGDLSGADARQAFGGRCEVYTDVEGRIAERLGDVEVMRASHHGSRFSSSAELLRRLDPEVSLISTGGRHRHPDRGVVTRLVATSTVFSTGRFSEEEWPEGPPPAVHVVGDILIDVGAGGRSYKVAGTRFRAFTDEEEERGEDGAEAVVGVGGVGVGGRRPQ